MKKIFTLALGFSVSMFSFAQTQRVLLTEEFTNASCGPCAAQNPAYNALIEENSTKIVAIKYQVNFPGFDPMNQQTQTEVAVRQSYYSINGVPTAQLNGSTSAVSTPNYAGAPANYTQAIIDQQYAVPAPFQISISHTLNAALTAMDVTVTVTAAQDLSNLGNPFLRIAMIERKIEFASAPGSNGETEFIDVMRKMLPNPTGTALATSWVNGASETFTLNNVAIPSYIYDKREIALVAFIQTDSDKAVHQAAMSLPVALPNYAGISSATAGLSGAITCNTSVTPSITIENTGTSPLTSCTISYTLNGGAAITQPFTGNVAPGATENVTLNALSGLTPGAKNLVFTLTDINGQGINSPTRTTTFYVIGNATPLNNFTENFTATTGFNSFVNVNTDNVGWTRNAAAGLGSPKGAMKMDFYNSPAGNVDDVILPPFDLTGQPYAEIEFSYAAAQYVYQNGDLTNDTLEVWSSVDCGASWNLVWAKSGTDLATVPAQTAGYTGTIDADYRTVTAPLLNTANQTRVLVMFRARSNFGNNAYVDNINVRQNTSSINELSSNGNISVYPNPAVDNLTVTITDAEMNSTIQVIDAVGKVVMTSTVTGKGNVRETLNIEELSNGIYMVRVNSGNQFGTQKLVIKR